VNIEPLRHSLKVKWLLYYQQNRHWLVQLRVWDTYQEQRRPLSSFILATVSNLEPEITELLPFIMALNSNPDEIVAALGLNFDPDKELQSMTEVIAVAETNGNSDRPPEDGNEPMETLNGDETNTSENVLSVMLPRDEGEVIPALSTQTSNLSAAVDKPLSSTGKLNHVGLVLSILAIISSLAIVFVGFIG
jgi:hypothetical protein